MPVNNYNRYYHGFIRGIIFLILLCYGTGLNAQEEPKYQRFQYHKQHWMAYYGKAFNIYFPRNAADSLYTFIFRETPDAIAKVKKATIKDVPKNLNIIIYPSIDQYYESNIGYYEPLAFTFPMFVIKGKRIVLAYNGSYANLKEQLYESLARTIVESGLKDDLEKEKGSTNKGKSSLSRQEIPFWFKEGCIRYFAHGWAISAEDKFRISFDQNNFGSWDEVLNFQPRLAGHAFCYFLTQQYHPTAVAQILFQLHKRKSLPKSLRLITKKDADTLFNQCFRYYQQRFSKEDVVETTDQKTITIQHKKGIVSNVLINDTKDLIAYTILSKGIKSVYLHDLKKRTTKKICSYKLPPWLNDHSADQYPLMAWHKDQKQIYVAKPRKGKIDIRRYNANGQWQESVTLDGVDGIISMQPQSDRDFLLTAYKKGQSDIVSYNENKVKYTAYTDDEYDDSSPLFTGNGNELLFISNRPKKYQERRTYLIGVGYKKDTLYQGIYRVDGTLLKPIVMDSAEYIKWDKLVLLKNNKALVTSTKYGAERHVVINYLNGTITQLGKHAPFQYLPESDEVSFYKADRDSIYTSQIPKDKWIKDNQSTDTNSSWLADYKAIQAKQLKEDSLLSREKDTTKTIFDEVLTQHNNKKKSKKNNKRSKTSGDGVTPYVLQLHSAYFSAKINNDYFINRYQPYISYQGQFKFPEISGMTKGGVTDLFENHHFTIAYSLPAAANGSNFFARYENTEKQYDWGIDYFRKVETLKPDTKRDWVDENGNKYPENAKVKTHYYEAFIKRPLSFYSYLGLQSGIRYDRTIFLATDKYSLDFLPINSTWSITTLSYNLNKLKPTIPLLYKGFMANSNIDFCKSFTQDEATVAALSLNLSYHQPIYKYITIVGQIHTGISTGDRLMLYNIGGKDNNITPQIDTNVLFSQSAPYAFQTLITPFRGYVQNSVYGDRYFLFNADTYFPLFQTLFPIETALPVINKLQLGILSDIANAKETWNPSNVNNSKWFWSYGFSVRSVLAGYPLRLDVAWPGTFGKRPVWYFTLNIQ